MHIQFTDHLSGETWVVKSHTRAGAAKALAERVFTSKIVKGDDAIDARIEALSEDKFIDATADEAEPEPASLRPVSNSPITNPHADHGDARSAA